MENTNLASYLHSTFCTADHNRNCLWEYETRFPDYWSLPTHRSWIVEANQLMTWLTKSATEIDDEHEQQVALLKTTLDQLIADLDRAAEELPCKFGCGYTAKSCGGQCQDLATATYDFPGLWELIADLDQAAEELPCRFGCGATAKSCGGECQDPKTDVDYPYGYDLPGMWEPADFMGGETDLPQSNLRPCYKCNGPLMEVEDGKLVCPSGCEPRQQRR